MQEDEHTETTTPGCTSLIQLTEQLVTGWSCSPQRRLGYVTILLRAMDGKPQDKYQASSRQPAYNCTVVPLSAND
jgi:hypothetical protein